MKCPICGEEIGKGKHKCLKCGYEAHDLSTIVFEEEQEPIKTVDIDPSQVYISGGSRASSGSLFEDIFGGGLFGGLFDGLFGGFFDGFDDGDDDGIEYDDFGRPISDVYNSDVVELSAHDVEHIDDRATTDASRTQHTHNGAQGDYGRKSDKKQKAHKNPKDKHRRGRHGS